MNVKFMYDFGGYANIQEYRNIPYFYLYMDITAEFMEIKAESFIEDCKDNKWLKNNGVGYYSAKAAVFVRSDIDDFINKAPEDVYFREKLGLVFGLFGRLRSIDYTKLLHKDILILNGMNMFFFLFLGKV